MVQLAIEPMAIIGLGVSRLHSRLPLLLVNGLLNPKVIALRIDASAISIRRMSHTVPITKGNHKDVALTTIASDVPMSIVIIAPNQVRNMLMAMVTIDRNAIQRGTKAKNTAVSTEEIRNKDNHIRASRVALRHMQGKQKRLKLFSHCLEGLDLLSEAISGLSRKVVAHSSSNSVSSSTNWAHFVVNDGIWTGRVIICREESVHEYCGYIEPTIC